MEILSYGEDGLTLWALTCRLGAMLEKLEDTSDPAGCRVFYRPSFGRAGGDRSSQIGEFDFVLLSQQRLFLGESKWDRSPEKWQDGILQLEPRQSNRHDVFEFYVKHWVCAGYASWAGFVEQAQPESQKRLAPAGSLLAANLETVLRTIESHFHAVPAMQDVLMYFHDGPATRPVCDEVSGTFKVLLMDYSGATLGNYVRLDV